MSYNQTEIDGTITRKSNRVETKLYLTHGPSNGRTLGAIASSFKYSVNFLTEGSDYQREVLISQAAKPGDVDRFTFEVYAEKSSVHDFTLSLSYNRTESTAAERIVLELFQPLHL